MGLFVTTNFVASFFNCKVNIYYIFLIKNKARMTKSSRLYLLKSVDKTEQLYSHLYKTPTCRLMKN